MKGSQDTAFKKRLKKMILEECDVEHISLEQFSDTVQIFSDESGLDLDSLDALQISVGLKSRFNVRIADSKEFRRRVTTINELADFIQPEE